MSKRFKNQRFRLEFQHKLVMLSLAIPVIFLILDQAGWIILVTECYEYCEIGFGECYNTCEIDFVE